MHGYLFPPDGVAISLRGLPSETFHEIRCEQLCVLLHDLDDICIFIDAKVIDGLEEILQH